jgi:hypothetical protein
LWPKSPTHNNQPVAFDIYVSTLFHPTKTWLQRHAIIDYVPSKFHGVISKIDGDTPMHSSIAAKLLTHNNHYVEFDIFAPSVFHPSEL